MTAITTLLVRLLLQSGTSLPAPSTSSPALAAVQGGPDQGGDGRELLRHRPQEAQLAQVPQLEGGSGEGDDEVLLALADPDHGDPLLLGLAACFVPQVASSSGSEIGCHQFISHLSKLLFT